MKRTFAALGATICLALWGPAAEAASAQALLSNQTYVSGHGSDSNDCSLAAPCRTWSRAVSQTYPGGEVDALDTMRDGNVQINKSITLDGSGVIAIVSASVGEAGVEIDNPQARVVLRGLFIDGGVDHTSTGGGYGVDIRAARTVRIKDVKIEDFQFSGIRSLPSNSPTRLTVLDSTIQDNGGNGIGVNAGSSGTAGTVNRVTLRGVELIDNDASGLATNAPGDKAVSVSVFDSLIADNSSYGIVSTGPASRVRMSDVDITGNAQGLRALNGGALLSWGNNHVADNGIDGAPTAMLGAK